MLAQDPLRYRPRYRDFGVEPRDCVPQAAACSRLIAPERIQQQLRRFKLFALHDIRKPGILGEKSMVKFSDFTATWPVPELDKSARQAQPEPCHRRAQPPPGPLKSRDALLLPVDRLEIHCFHRKAAQAGRPDLAEGHLASRQTITCNQNASLVELHAGSPSSKRRTKMHPAATATPIRI